MIDLVTGLMYAKQAQSSKYDGIKYATLDCQGFVERVLKDCGVKKTDGIAYNWKGSNSMWRNALSWKGTLEEAKNKFGEIPIGAWVFILSDDGGEKDRGYHDSEGNAKHVGIYIGNDRVRDSTRTTNGRDGVGYRLLSDFNRAGLPKMLDYTVADDILFSIHVLRDENATDSAILEALENLTRHMRGV